MSLSTGSIEIQPVAEGAVPITFNIATTTKIRLHKRVEALELGAFVIVVAGRDALTGELSPDALAINVVPKRSPRPEAGAEKPATDPRNGVELEGVLEGISTTTNRWIIDGTEVEIDASTQIDEGVTVGDLVEVDGLLREDGTILALEIEARDDSRQVATVTRIVGIFQGLDDDGNWIIGGTSVKVGPEADTDGSPAPGQRVKVKALVQSDGSLLAREIENIHGHARDEVQSRRVEIEGILQEIDADGNWIINGTSVSIGPDTRLKGSPAVGQRVKVSGRQREDGSILATGIEGERKEPSKRARKRKVELEGVIQEVLADGTLVIDGIQVSIVELTELEGDPVAGDYVELEAFLAKDGSLTARELDSKGTLEADEVPELSEVRIEGTIERINDDGTLVVNGITVATTTLSEIRGQLTAGGSVKIEGVLQEDGTLLASEIRGEGRRATASGSEVDVEGLVDAVNRDENGRPVSIVVDGLTIAVEALTRIDGAPGQGSRVRVKGIVRDGLFLAGRIDVKEVDEDEEREARGPATMKIEGLIESVASSTDGIIGITVNGVDLVIAGTTNLETDLRVGDAVELRAVLRDGAVVASHVKAENTRPERLARSAFKLTGVVEPVDRDANGNIVGVLVNGRSIEVQPITRIKNVVEPGVEVQVQGIVIGDTLVARQIERDDEARGGEQRSSGRDGRDELEFRGVIAEITADATPTRVVLEDGTGFLVPDDVELRGDLVIGAQVRVRAESADGVNVVTAISAEPPRGRRAVRSENGDDGDEPERGRGGLQSRADLEQVAQGLYEVILCPVCPGESIARSQNPLAVQMRTIVIERLTEGWSGQRIKDFFVERYGASVLLKSPTEGDDQGPRDTPLGRGDTGEDEEDAPIGESGPAGPPSRVELEFRGIVASITADARSTTVALEDGTTFVVREITEITGEIVVGASVEVRATESDGRTLATRVKVEGSLDARQGEDRDDEENTDRPDQRSGSQATGSQDPVRGADLLPAG